MKNQENNRKTANKKVVEILQEVGDDGEKKREVTHWFYFNRFDDLKRFKKYAYDIGFQTRHEDKEPEKGKFLLIFIGRKASTRTP